MSLVSGSYLSCASTILYEYETLDDLDTFKIQYSSYDFFFFFQAEDGIRDVAVTGVQTCALPIYLSWSCSVANGTIAATRAAAIVPFATEHDHERLSRPIAWATYSTLTTSTPSTKIGRASCRERV